MTTSDAALAMIGDDIELLRVVTDMVDLLSRRRREADEAEAKRAQQQDR